MTFKQKYYRYSNTWQDKAHIVNVFHKLQMLTDKWSMRKTANYFDISVGAVSEACLIADNMNLITDADGREKALKFLKAQGAEVKVVRATQELQEMKKKLEIVDE